MGMSFLLIFLATLVVVHCDELKNVEITLEHLIRDDPVELDWWQTAVFYQIYPRSFKDSNNDGIGDLQGIIQRLDHLADMGITAAWLSPIFKSPQVDQGYDISDYYSINPEYGTEDDLRELVDKAHKLGIKIILDFVPNHTSDQHEWFQMSVNDSTGPYGDFYVWKDCVKHENGTITPPNNWISNFKDSAWEYNEIRNQCYLHQFSIPQPDLNYNNPDVVQAMKDVLIYWMEFGIDGFRCDAVNTLFEDPEFTDEPPSNIPGVNENEYNYLDHIYTVDQPQTFDMIYQWREVLDNFTETNETDTKVMMTEAYSTMEKTMLYYGLSDGSRKGAHFTFNFNFITSLSKGFGVNDLSQCIKKWLENLPRIYTSNWVLGNHDNHRAATRFGTEYIDGLHMITALLPGVMVTYNGEEIGMEDGEVTCEQGHDPQAIKDCDTFDRFSRDFERTPFQWDDSVNAGFNEGAEPWLPVSNKSKEVNLAAQKAGTEPSHYKVYKALIEARKSFNRPTEFETLSIVHLSDNVVQIIRMNQVDDFNLVFNIGGENETVQFKQRPGDYEVVVASSGSTYKYRDIIEDGVLELNPYDSVIVRNTIVSGGPSITTSVSLLMVLCFGFIMYLLIII